MVRPKGPLWGARSQEKVPFVLDCARCHRVLYCEEACKNAHEERHKVICALLDDKKESK